jgi:hypothetical protein
MLVMLGVVLLVVGVVALVDGGLTSNGTTDVHLLGWHIGTMGPLRTVGLGAIAGFVIGMGVMSVLAGQRRSMRIRRDQRRTLRGTREENRRLNAALDEKQAHVEAAAAAEPVGPDVRAGDVDAYPNEGRHAAPVDQAGEPVPTTPPPGRRGRR